MEEDLEFWRGIHDILNQHTYPNHEQGVLLNFNSSQSDYH